MDQVRMTLAVLVLTIVVLVNIATADDQTWLVTLSSETTFVIGLGTNKALQLPSTASGLVTVSSDSDPTQLGPLYLCASLVPVAIDFNTSCPLGGYYENGSSGDVLDLIPGSTYWVTVYAPNATGTVSFNLTLSVAECGNDEFGNQCVKTPTVIAAKQSVSVPAQSWVYFQLPATTAGVSYVEVALSYPIAANQGLYARQGQLPTTTHFAHVGNRTGYLAIANPSGTWFVGIYNGISSVLNTDVQYDEQTCPASMYGYLCQSSSKVVDTIYANDENNATSLVAAQTRANWTYFAVSGLDKLADNSFFRVSVASPTDAVAPPIFALVGSLPTFSNYLAIASGAYANQLILPTMYNGKQDWYIGVYGMSNYYLYSGNCAKNCSSKGSCNCDGAECSVNNFFVFPTNTTDSFGVCSCESKKYSIFDCSTSPFKIYYVVLISIGAAIVLAVAIGVPIYCYVVNRNRNAFERV